MTNLLIALAPEAFLVITALVVLGIGVSAPKARGAITAATLLGGLVAAAALLLHPVDGNFLHGMVVLNPLARLFKLVLLGLGLVSVVFAAESFPKLHFAEALALLLFSMVGMMLLAGTEDLLMIFLALELTSLPLYILAAFAKESRASAEAGLKYFLIGSVAAAFLLYGLSLIYGVAGSTNLRVIAKLSGDPDPLLIAGIALTLLGFAFKIAVVPFQLWAPDVYEGAPTAAAALIASGSKVAGVFILTKILTLGLGHWTGTAGWGQFAPGWAPVLALMAAASVVLGNVAALVQSNVKRLLAYSAIAHGGYLLIGLCAADAPSLTAVLFYVIIYALTTAGAFGVVVIVEKQRGGSHLEDFEGLGKSSPVLALCLLVFLISLAGIPPLAGFFGKFYLFTSALANGRHLWLVILAVAMNAVSLYYYLIVLKHALVLPAPKETVPTAAPASKFLVVLLALAVLALGLAPNALIGPLSNGQTVKNIIINTLQK
ncbi:MAG: NADH-quinone oxidoreductase subunit N [Chthoniobacterales bacterium]|nr:NADH-quinone oxidoreductase subunit N [Chthoniobacterales bacterium]